MKKTTNYVLLGLIAVFSILFVFCIVLLIMNNNFNFGGKKVSDILKESTSKQQVYDNEEGKDVFEYSFFGDDVYNRIITFKDNGVKVYAFRMETDTDVGNDGSKFSYEIGRIYLNSKNPSKSRCTFNYSAKLNNQPVKWFECSESKFLKDLPKIAEIKKAAWEGLKSLYEEERLIDICSMWGSENRPECAKFNKFTDKEWDKYFNDLEKNKEKKLMDLHCTTLEKP